MNKRYIGLLSVFFLLLIGSAVYFTVFIPSSTKTNIEQLIPFRLSDINLNSSLRKAPNTPFAGITKQQVEELLQQSGIQQIKLDTVFPFDKKTMMEIQKQSTISGALHISNNSVYASALAGQYKGWHNSNILIDNGRFQREIVFWGQPLLWINDANKLRVVSIPLSELVNSGQLNQYLQLNDLVLVLPIIQTQKGEILSQNLVVFK